MSHAASLGEEPKFFVQEVKSHHLKRSSNIEWIPTSSWLQSFLRVILTPDLSRCQRGRAHYCSATHTDPGHLNSNRRKKCGSSSSRNFCHCGRVMEGRCGALVLSLCKNPVESLWCFSKNMGGLKSWSRMNSSSLLNGVRAELCLGSQSKKLSVLTDSIKQSIESFIYFKWLKQLKSNFLWNHRAF